MTISNEQLDQLVLRAVGVLIFINQHMPEATMPVVANLIILSQQVNGHQQEIIKVEGIIGSQSAAIAAVGFRHQLSTLPASILLKLLRHPALILSITDGPAHLLRFKTLRIKTQLLGHNFLH